jgi:hypothetical protein
VTPFSATVVEKGDYRNARVYGHITEIDMSGRIKGHTSMILRFDRLVMPDGRRARIHAEIVELYYAPSGEKVDKVDVEGAIESGGRGRNSIEHTVIGAGAGALWDLRRRQRRRHRFCDRWRRWAGDDGISRAPEDHTEQWPRNANSHHGPVIHPPLALYQRADSRRRIELSVR